MNSKGQVVGGVTVDNQSFAAVWDMQAGTRVIEGLSGRSYAAGISESGIIVGYFVNPSGSSHAFLWNAEQGSQDLGQLAGIRIAFADAVNDRTEVVGSALLGGSFRAYLWSPDKGVVDLGTNPNEGSRASGINNLGMVVGSHRIDGEIRAFVWNEELGLVDLNDLLPEGCPWDILYAWDINDSGQIVGLGSLEGNSSNVLLKIEQHDGRLLLTAPVTSSGPYGAGADPNALAVNPI
jgi:probable HAF family extracellular repeat protein